jgi:UPF0755 protein
VSRRGRRPVRKDAGWFKAVLRRWTLLPLLAVVLVVAALSAYRIPGPAAQPSDIVLPKGAGVRQIAGALKGAGVISSKTLFQIAARVSGKAGRLKAGEYAFRAHVSMADVLGDIADGKVVRRFVVVPEGWTSEMAAEAVRAEPALSGTVETPPEGSLLPDGYQIQRGEDRTAVMQRMRQARDDLLAQLWAGRDPDVPLASPQQAVILASVVEKETGVPAERPRIAAVFENRLRKGSLLQSDPTVIYGVSQGRPLGRGLTRSELDTPTAYNTYRIAGLPPTPIANPGRAALAAVLNPPKSQEFFFVADGTGGHVFASTLAEHLANVDKWRAIERARGAGGSGK